MITETTSQTHIESSGRELIKAPGLGKTNSAVQSPAVSILRTTAEYEPSRVQFCRLEMLRDISSVQLAVKITPDPARPRRRDNAR